MTTSTGGSAAAVSKRPFVIDSTPPRAAVMFDVGAQEELAPLASREPADGGTGSEGRGGPDIRFQGDEAGASEGRPAGQAILPVRGPVGSTAAEVAPEPILRARKYLAGGSSLSGTGDVSLARELMEGFVAGEPWNVEANVLLGEARAREADRLAKAGGLAPEELLRRYAEAAAALRTGLRAARSGPPGRHGGLRPASGAAGTNGQHAPARVTGRARFWLGACHFQRARTFYQQLHSLDDGVTEARIAVEEYERALAIPPNSADEHYNAGMAYYFLALAGPEDERAGKMGRAEDLLEEAITKVVLRPESGEDLDEFGRAASDRVAGGAHYYLADLARRRKNRPKALEHARKALEKLGADSPHAAQIREMMRRMGGR